MKKIKQRPMYITPRVSDKAAHISRNARAAFLNTKEEKNPDIKPESYASDKVSRGSQRVLNSTFEQGRRYAKKTRGALRRTRGLRGSSKAIKASGRNIKATGKTVKTTARSVKTTAKTTKIAANTARKAAAASARAAKAASRAAAQGIKLAVKAVIAAVKAIAAAIKGLSAVIAAGGWVVLVIVLVIAAVAALLCSPFGIFYSSETTEDHTPSTVMAELSQELDDKIDTIKLDHPDASEVTVTYEGSEDGSTIQNGADILAVFAVRVALDPDDPTEVVILDEAKETILKKTYWDMTRVTYSVAPIEEEPLVNDPSSSSTPEPPPVRLNINVDCRSYDEMITVYGFNADQVEVLEELMHPRYQQLFMSLLGIEMSDELTADEIAEIRSSLPDHFTISQDIITEKAQSLVGRVYYFWGGKSYAIGWDDRWGKQRKVTAEGSPSTGTVRPFGLDCSGFTAWVYVNSGISKDKVTEVFGTWSGDQWRYSLPVEWNQAQVGDLAFLAIPGTRKVNHVGVVVGFDNGEPLVAHCSSSYNNVVLTEGRESGFRYIRRPVVLTQISND